jgi:hypothetical protein
MPMVSVHGSTDSSLKGGRRFPDQRPRLKQRRGISSFNLIRSFRNGRPRCFLLHWNRWNRGLGGASMPPPRESSCSRYKASFSNPKVLHDLDDERYPFWPLTVVQTDHRKLVTERQLSGMIVFSRGECWCQLSQLCSGCIGINGAERAWLTNRCCWENRLGDLRRVGSFPC